MRFSNWSILLVVLVAGCSSATPEQTIINDAADALGGADQILAVNTLVIEGTGQNTNLGQSLSPDNLQTLNVTQSKRSIDFANNRTRLEQTRTATFGVNPQPQRQNLGVDGDVAYNIGGDGNATRAAEQAAKDRRMEVLHHPIGAVRAALREGAQLANARQEGTEEAVDITTAQGDKLTLYIDGATRLPSKVVSVISANNNWPMADVNIETSFANYAAVEGLQLPARLTTKTHKYTTADIQVSSNAVNADVGDLSAPEAARSAPAPTLPTPTVTAEVVANGIWYLAGQSHHSVLVEFADHVALIEAPQNEVRTGAVLAKVKELSSKPLRYVVNTHAHFDHSGGIRRAMAEDGVTIITHEGNKAFYEEIARHPATVFPDTLAQAPKTPTIVGVTDKYELKDASRTVEIHHIPNAHSDTMLMVYFPTERLLIEADLYTPPNPGAQPPPQGFPNAPSIVDTVQKLGLRPARLLPIHGRVVPYTMLEAAVRATRS
jgi:glyoxylase-like metal-dependent hydrolase (beta-lactamase superfamily II)